MRIVLDYGGTIVDRIDESNYSRDLGSDGVPHAGYVAYKAYSLGILDNEQQYIETLSALTGLSEEECRNYLQRRRNAESLPEGRQRLLHTLAENHSLVLFSDQVREWIVDTLERFGVRGLFDDIIVSSELGTEKPHPKGYLRAKKGYDRVIMVSDELNEDLLMADYFGMTTVWVENSREDVIVEPDYVIDDFVELEEVIEHLMREE